MSDIRIIPGVETATRITADGSYLGVRGTRDGAMVFQDWKMALAMEGRVFHAGGGIDMTPLTNTAFDQDQPMLSVSVPSGTTILPLRVEIAIMSEEQTTDATFYVARVTVAQTAGLGVAAETLATCTRSDLPRLTNCEVQQEVASNMVVTGYSGMAMLGTPTASVAPFNWVYEPETPEVLVGPATLIVNLSGSTANPDPRIMVTWAEFPSNQLS